MKIYLNLLTKKANSGFTLVELILASVISLLVISAAGAGAVLMTQKNIIASADSDIKYNLGRAVDFISEEVKTASAIRDSVSSINAPSFGSSGKTIVLAIEVPGVDEDIIYYTQTPGGPYLGNLAIHRWGPNLGADGAYTANKNDQSTWKPKDLLVDLIATTPKTTSCPTLASPRTSPIKIPSSSYANQGFFVCVDTNSGVPGSRKSVEIHASASAQNNNQSNRLGWGSGSGGGYAAAGKPIYEVITQAYTRASDGVPITLSGSNIGFTETAKATVAVTSEWYLFFYYNRWNSIY